MIYVIAVVGMLFLLGVLTAVLDVLLGVTALRLEVRALQDEVRGKSDRASPEQSTHPTPPFAPRSGNF